ncbi:MAG: hypothetical protein ACRD5M_13065 [Candidatus Acidiferrales bacterium]
MSPYAEKNIWHEGSALSLSTVLSGKSSDSTTAATSCTLGVFRAGCKFVVLSLGFELLGAVAGAAGTEFECVLPVAGGCDALDLLLADFVAFDFIVLVRAAAVRVLAFVATGSPPEFPARTADFFTGAIAGFDATGGGASAAVVNTISTGALSIFVGMGALIRAGVTAAGDAGTLAATGTLATMLAAVVAGAGAGAGGTLLATVATAAGVFAGLLAGISETAAGRAAALAADAKLAALAAGLLLSSGSGGKLGNVLSGT